MLTKMVIGVLKIITGVQLNIHVRIKKKKNKHPLSITIYLYIINILYILYKFFLKKNKKKRYLK